MTPLDARHSLTIRLGFDTRQGRRADNQDYVAAMPAPGPARPVLAALADGVGGHKGGRVAAELTVRGLFEGFAAMPATIGPRQAAFRALDAINGWIHAQGRTDPDLEQMAAAFSAVIFTRRAAHILHIGDTRVYRLSAGHLEQLTMDHAGRRHEAHMLTRAIGFEPNLRLDFATVPLRQHDRFLICSDGLHGSLSDRRILELLATPDAPEESARMLCDAALDAGSQDNVSVVVADIVDLPPADQDELGRQMAQLPILAPPKPGDVIDGFTLGEMLSDGQYSRLFRATEAETGRACVMKFPQARVAQDTAYRLAFVREAWVAARVRSPHIGEVIELPPGRQTRLYSVMPFYDGETLEARLKRAPPVGLAEGIAIATRLARAVTSLHRNGIIHRDIKPDNVILLKDGGLRLIDLGVARVPQMEEFPSEDIPGTASYMAPELFAGEKGDALSDQFALGVTVYRLFTGAWPYGEIEPFSRPRFGIPAPLSKYRPDLPAWLDAVIGRAIAPMPTQRFGDVLEFAHELDNGAQWTRPAARESRSLHERHPVLFWQLVSAGLLVALLARLARG